MSSFVDGYNRQMLVDTVLAKLPLETPVPLSRIKPEGMSNTTFLHLLKSMALNRVLSVRRVAEEDPTMAFSLSTKLYVPIVHVIPPEFQKRGVPQYLVERSTVQEFIHRMAEPIVRTASSRIMSNLKLLSPQK